jgi:diguanylate cyclase (GGDEF)-like protein
MRPMKWTILQIAIILAITELVCSLLIDKLLPAPLHILSTTIHIILLATIATPLIVFNTIRPLRRINQKLLHKTLYHHPLTNLGNRRTLYDSLRHVLAYNTRHRIYGALLLIDLDELHEIQTKLGQEAVETVLNLTAKRLLASIRIEDIACHTGGSQFYVLLTGLTVDKSSSKNNAVLTAKRIISALNKPFHYEKQEIDIKAYIGLRIITPEITSIRRIFHDLDMAIYQARSSSFSQIGVFAEELT